MGEHSVSYVPSSFSSEMTLDELRDAMMEEAVKKAVLEKAIETTTFEGTKTEPDEKDKKEDKKRKKKKEEKEEKEKGAEKTVKTYSLSTPLGSSSVTSVSPYYGWTSSPYYYGDGDTSGLGTIRSIDTVGVRPDLETVTIDSSDYRSHSEPVYAESFLPHLVRAQDEGRRRNIEMDTVVIDRGVAVSQGLDHVDMILGLKVKYAKEGSLPMDSAFIIMKDDKKKEPEKKAEPDKKRRKVPLRSASFKVADSIASISGDVHPHQLYSLYDPVTNAFYVEKINKDGELERVKLPDLTAEETRKLAEKMENEERERIRELWK